MCMISFIGEHYTERWNVPPLPQVAWPREIDGVTRIEFEMLRREVENMKALLIKAKLYDEEHGEPDCEMEDKVAILRKVADLVGVSLDDVLGSPAG